MQYVRFKSEFLVQAQAGQGLRQPGAARQEEDPPEPVEDEVDQSNAVTQPPPAPDGANDEAEEVQPVAKAAKATKVVKRKTTDSADETADKPRTSGRKR